MTGFAQETFWGAHAPPVLFAAPRRELSVAIRRLTRRILPIDWRGRQSQVVAATAPQNGRAAANANLRLSRSVRL